MLPIIGDLGKSEQGFESLSLPNVLSSCYGTYLSSSWLKLFLAPHPIDHSC